MLLLPFAEGPLSATASLDDLVEAVLTDAVLCEASEQFLSSTATPHQPPHTVHVLQAEYALIDLAEERPIIGSSDATTCVIAVFVCQDSQRAAIAHLDKPTSQRHVFLAQLLQGMVRPTCYLVGAYSEPMEFSARSVRSVLSFLHWGTSLPVTLHLACLLRHNTDAGWSPRTRQLAVDLRDFKPCSALQRDRGPFSAQRSAAFWLGRQPELRLVYDTAWGEFRPPPLPRLDPLSVAMFRHWLRLDDAELLQRTSTSPEHEGPGYVHREKEGWGCILLYCMRYLPRFCICMQSSPTG